MVARLGFSRRKVMARGFWYVYGIVPASAELAGAPSGVEDAPVVLERSADGAVAAVVSVVPHDDYAPATLEARTSDVEWLGPRAVAHDRVLSWVSDRAAVIPLPMFTIFSGADAVRGMLVERSASIRSSLARIASHREYALRVYRVDAEVLRDIGELSPRLRELERAAEEVSPGQRYLLQRKLEAERKNELRVVSQRVAAEIFDALGEHAAERSRAPIPRGASDASRGVQILNAAFLVSRDAYDAFQSRLGALVAQHSRHGFLFDFTGPWPAYHFVSDDVEHTADA
jgi:Gas vesicle synthesis protein GvpL/GvpF